MVSHFHCYDPNCPGDHSGREIRAAEGQRPSSGGTAGAGRGAIGALATDPQRARLFLGSSCVALGTLRPCPPHVSEVKTQLHIRPRDTLFPSTKAFPRVDLGLRAASAMWGPKIESRGRRPLWPVPRGKTTGRNSGLELQWCSRRGVLPYHHRHLTHRTGCLLLPDTRGATLLSQDLSLLARCSAQSAPCFKPWTVPQGPGPCYLFLSHVFQAPAASFHNEDYCSRPFQGQTERVPDLSSGLI